MQPAVDHCYRATYFSKILPFTRYHLKVAIEKHRPSALRSIKRFGTKQLQLAIDMHSRATKRIIRTFKITVVKQYTLPSHQRARVKPTQKMYPPCHDPVALTNSQLRLHNGIGPSGSVKLRHQRINQVDVTVVAHCKILNRQVITNKMKHGKITNRPLCLSPITRQHHLLRFVRQSHKPQSVTLHFHSIRNTTAGRHTHRLIIRIINPVNIRCQINGHRSIGRTVFQLPDRRLKRRKSIRIFIGYFFR